jgi:GYF domain 2
VSQVQWYLARDGQQYGPLSEPELAKFIELGHLQPTDLLWRDGFPDWRPAMVVFPPQRHAPRPAPGPRPAPSAQRQAYQQPSRQQAAPRAAALPTSIRTPRLPA